MFTSLQSVLKIFNITKLIKIKINILNLVNKKNFVKNIKINNI